ncbi:Zn-ribbon domain-containing OB-fold protein [Sulfolobus sp. S-194]|uniref:Zn-ribbon domain-containing OB-fold protein n=1 Tax=Sulfolobus sp. S-194 TaxID=2512240 RepID=UPI001436E6AE|nr:Zn-ribbon domain-containing OB-fold protein [Sulfolobus sp. S-194]QIW24716.1 Zn-ribbon domain-containing OB-fold protein [Sulfolobus sp. S-194]
MSWDKIGIEDKLLSWHEIMEAEEYVYTVGVAGEEFFNGLKQKKIIGGKCPRCGRIYVPARLYCEECFVKNDFVEVTSRPYIDTYTVIYKDDEGNKLEKPQVIALIRFEGTHGGLLGYVEGEANIGKEVEILEYKIPLIVRVK